MKHTVRMSPAELQAVQRAGMLTRFALLGHVTFVMVDLPGSGTAGTGLDEECVQEHHGIVVRGSFTVHHADGRNETFEPGDAFYLPPGPPSHHFTSAGQCVVEGFAAVRTEIDTSATALDALGFLPADAGAPLAEPPATVKSWLARWISRPSTVAAPVRTPSAANSLSAIPNRVALCLANNPTS